MTEETTAQKLARLNSDHEIAIQDFAQELTELLAIANELAARLKVAKEGLRNLARYSFKSFEGVLVDEALAACDLNEPFKDEAR